MKDIKHSLSAFAAILLVVTAAGTASTARAQTYPTKPVTIVNPYPAGGGADVMVRILAQELTTQWKHPVVIEARPGAGTTISATYVARAQADGYTLLMSTTQHATAPSLYKNLTYDFLKSFAPVTTFAESTFVLVTRSDLKVDNVSQLMALVKQKGSAMNYGSSGPGGIPHLAGAWLNMVLGANATHVPFQGTAPAFAAILGGQVDYLFADVSVVPQVRSGKVKGLAVTTPKRVSALPDVPTMVESIPGFVVSVWVGLEAPAGTPRPIIDRINASVQTALKSEAAIKRFADVASEPKWMTPEDFAAFKQAEVQKYAKLIKESGAKLE